jgi:hypothetical protein
MQRAVSLPKRWSYTVSNTEDDMDKPVTKRELHRALEVWGGALEARLEAKIKANGDENRHQLSVELAQHTNRILEETQKMLGAYDEKYRDLPDRVDVLEKAVLTPKRQRRR